MIKKIDDLIQKEIIPGFKGKFIHTQNFTVAFWNIEEGKELPEHSHIHEQTTQVIKGT